MMVTTLEPSPRHTGQSAGQSVGRGSSVERLREATAQFRQEATGAAMGWRARAVSESSVDRPPPFSTSLGSLVTVRSNSSGLSDEVGLRGTFGARMVPPQERGRSHWTEGWKKAGWRPGWDKPSPELEAVQLATRSAEEASKKAEAEEEAKKKLAAETTWPNTSAASAAPGAGSDARSEAGSEAGSSTVSRPRGPKPKGRRAEEGRGQEGVGDAGAKGVERTDTCTSGHTTTEEDDGGSAGEERSRPFLAFK